MAHYLILENDEEFFNNTYLSAFTDSQTTEKEFNYVHVKTVEEAHKELAKTRFSGAILDLCLTSAETAEGNEIARRIHSDYLIPIAVVSGFLPELDPELADLAKSKTGFLREFNKNGKIADVFDFLMEVENSGVIQIFGPGGELTKMMSDIFWKHLGEVLKRWRGQTMTPQDRKRVLRHAVSHMIGALQSNDSGDWDNFLPSEVYIWPPICTNEMPGHIYEDMTSPEIAIPKATVENTSTAIVTLSSTRKRYFLLVTPYCDLAKMKERHFIEVLPFADFSGADKTRNLLEKKNYRYHMLPPAPFFLGGVADFASLLTITSEESARRFVHKGSLIEPYWRELVNRLGAWLGRQGTPEFDRDQIIDLVRPQWLVPPAAVKKPKQDGNG